MYPLVWFLLRFWWSEDISVVRKHVKMFFFSVEEALRPRFLTPIGEEVLHLSGDDSGLKCSSRNVVLRRWVRLFISLLSYRLRSSLVKQWSLLNGRRSYSRLCRAWGFLGFRPDRRLCSLVRRQLLFRINKLGFKLFFKLSVALFLSLLHYERLSTTCHCFEFDWVGILLLLLADRLNLCKTFWDLNLPHFFFKNFYVSFGSDLLHGLKSALFCLLRIYLVFICFLGSLDVFLELLFFCFFECPCFVLGLEDLWNYHICISATK